MTIVKPVVPHFYKAHSRLGLINIPYHGVAIPNNGVENAPEAILSPVF